MLQFALSIQIRSGISASPCVEANFSCAHRFQTDLVAIPVSAALQHDNARSLATSRRLAPAGQNVLRNRIKRFEVVPEQSRASYVEIHETSLIRAAHSLQDDQLCKGVQLHDLKLLFLTFVRLLAPPSTCSTLARALSEGTMPHSSTGFQAAKSLKVCCV